MEPHQETVGGSLVGNKYLGYVDSKPEVELGFEANGIPKELSSSSISGLLEEDGGFRCYNYNIDKICPETEDKKWSKQDYYNEKYDAYDGDYMYDIYRNALVIFDHNIKPSKTLNVGGDTIDSNISLPSEKTKESSKRATPLIPYPGDYSNNIEGPVYKHTKDMYGDGYVLLYNVIPDGTTLTFVEKQFALDGTVNDKNYRGNYSQNIIKLNEIPLDYILKHFDGSYFTQKEDKISLTGLAGGGGIEVDFSSGSLKNIYNAPIAKSAIVITDKNGYISPTSALLVSDFSSLPGRVASLENKLPNLDEGEHYITSTEFNELKEKVDGMGADEPGNIPGNGYRQTCTLLLIDPKDPKVPSMDKTGNMGGTNSDTGKTYTYSEAIEFGTLYLKDRTFTPQEDGFIFINGLCVMGSSPTYSGYYRLCNISPEIDENGNNTGGIIKNVEFLSGQGQYYTSATSTHQCHTTLYPLINGATYEIDTNLRNDPDGFGESGAVPSPSAPGVIQIYYFTK
jgi:hypothetical protein